jgi:hypothetical protein
VALNRPQTLSARGVRVALCRVMYLVHRSTLLVAAPVVDQERITILVQKQGHIVLTVDSVLSDGGQEVFQVVRTAATRLPEPWSMPVPGVICDDQKTMGCAVTVVVPHQVGPFPSLTDATKLLFRADRNGTAG